MKEIFWKNLEDGAVESAELVKFSQFLLSYSSIIETDSTTYTLMFISLIKELLENLKLRKMKNLFLSVGKIGIGGLMVIPYLIVKTLTLLIFP